MNIGVYVCHCGINIASVVDVEALTEYAKTLPDVVISRNYQYMCSDPGQGLIKKDVEEFDLDRVVVCACSPRMHEPTFRKAIAESGLNPYMLEVANIRENVSWVHTDGTEATEKSRSLVRSALAKARLLEPIGTLQEDVTHAALVVGAGIAGIQTALDIADNGFKVYLVEQTPSVGGRMAQLDKTFPTLDCSACILTPKMVDVSRHPNIELMTYSEVTDISGYVGNFNVKIHKKPRYVDADKCTGCGACAEACRLSGKIPNYHDAFIGKRSAIYIPFPQAVPSTHTIDPERCLMLTKGKCGKSNLCVEACGAEAIDFEQKAEDVEVNVGAIVVATGFDTFDPSLKPELGYDLYDNVITGLEFERLVAASGPTGGKILINDKEPKEIVLIQCVGSRDETVGNEYCSRVCCMYTAKHAHLLRDKIPDAKITVFYIDVRAFGKGFEEFYDRVRKEEVLYRRGNPSEVYKKGDKLVVRAEDTFSGKPIEVEADLVVLAVGMVPRSDSDEIQSMLKLSRSSDKFFMEAHPKLKPIDTAVDGVFLSGTCQGPKDIPDTVGQASGAAARACTILSKDKMDFDMITANINVDICIHCGKCFENCIYQAIIEVEEEDIYRVIDANCKACGKCASSCPANAVELRYTTDIQIEAQVDDVLEGEEDSFIAFCCNWCSYAAADLAGTTRMKYSPRIKIIRVPCSGRVAPNHIMHAFEKGAKGVMIAGCMLGDCHYIDGNYRAAENVEIAKKALGLMGIKVEKLEMFFISASDAELFTEAVEEMDVRC